MTVPSSRPDTPAQQHADTLRKLVRSFGRPQHDAALDALLKEIERLTAEKTDAIHKAVKMARRAEAAERERNRAQADLAARNLGYGELEREVFVLRIRAEAAERERDEMQRFAAEETERAIAAEAVAERREAERDDLLHALQEIWDDWCSGHMGDCNCIVCSLTADALNIDRAALADEGQT